jgi:protocatechuate 3,4-dioxygenase beta subunit
MIEIWHADARGDYTRLGTVPADDLACLLRGNVRSADGGRYSVRTINPGVYTGRPRHIHMRVSAPGYRTLVTQMYFPPQEGVDPRLLARPAKPSAAGAASFEFDLAIAPL